MIYTLIFATLVLSETTINDMRPGSQFRPRGPPPFEQNGPSFQQKGKGPMQKGQSSGTFDKGSGSMNGGMYGQGQGSFPMNGGQTMIPGMGPGNMQGGMSPPGNMQGGMGKGKGPGASATVQAKGTPGSNSQGSWTSSGPNEAPLLGDVGFTTVSSADGKIQVGEDIYGPFEAGFGSQQDFVLKRVGCSNPSDGYIEGGVDTHLSEEVMGHNCGVELPRKENGKWIGLLDQCGGHTREYHFHERLSCLYDLANKDGGHSTQIGQALDSQYLYGKWESKDQLPDLDACGGHFGVTPDSAGKSVYHYHVQENAPFTFGCYGPNKDGSLVTLQQCRNLYSGCGDGNLITYHLSDRTVEYDAWCPCYDATGSNTGTQTLNVFLTQTHSLPAAKNTEDTTVVADVPFWQLCAVFVGAVTVGTLLGYCTMRHCYRSSSKYSPVELNGLV